MDHAIYFHIGLRIQKMQNLTYLPISVIHVSAAVSAGCAILLSVSLVCVIKL